MTSIQAAAGPVWDTWEWREGRLLAYELILKFLITNHVHYLFPTAMLGAPYRPKEGTLATGLRQLRRRLSIPSGMAMPRSHQRASSGSWNGRFFNSSTDDDYRRKSAENHAASPLSSSGGLVGYLPPSPLCPGAGAIATQYLPSVHMIPAVCA